VGCGYENSEALRGSALAPGEVSGGKKSKKWAIDDRGVNRKIVQAGNFAVILFVII